MKYQVLKTGDQLQVGDIIVHITCFGNSKLVVYRLTKKHAWAKYNDVAEDKFPLIYNDIFFSALPRPNYNTTTYKVYRSIPEQKQ